MPLRSFKKKPHRSIVLTGLALVIWVVLRESFETFVSKTFNLESTVAGITVGFLFVLGWYAGLQKVSKG